MNAEDFARVFGGAKRSGSAWQALCPAHDDHEPSLSISDGNGGKVLVKCHVGCATKDVLAAKSLTFKDLMPESSTKRVEAAVYDYRDEAGQVRYQVVRFAPKDFRQRRPSATGGFVWNLKGVSRLLYRLPELLAADPEEIVFVVEGEKDVDLLRKHRLIATCNSEGAGRWRPELSESLRNRLVVIIPDNDDAGRKHAREVAQYLRSIAKSVRVVELNGLEEKADVSDWFAAGHTDKELLQLAVSAEAPVGDLAKLLDETRIFVQRFVVMSSAESAVVTLWIFHTHAADAAETTPFLSVTSAEMRSGKTRLLEVAELLVARPWRAISPSEAVVFRKIQDVCPTLLLDEVDAIFGDKAGQHEGLRAILNAGNRRGVSVDRCVGKGPKMTIEPFSVWCPRMLGGIGRLPRTVADRSLPIRLKRRAQGETVEPFRRRDVEPPAKNLHDRLESAAANAIETLQAARPTTPKGLDDRTADGVEPLLAIADLAGGEWPERARRAVGSLAETKEGDDESLGMRLLIDCRTIFDANQTDRLSTANLIAALIAIEESPWGEINRGKPIVAHRLAKMLRTYDILPPRSIRFGEESAKGYYRDWFTDAWSRYLPPETNRTGAPAQTWQENINKDGMCAGVPVNEVDGEKGVTPSTPAEEM